MSKASQRTVLVTVGSTKFEALIRAVDTNDVAEALHRKGYTHLVIQKGTGSYLPRTLVPKGTSNALETGLTVEFFDHAPSIADRIAAADLVISHAGSGSTFESLSAGKVVIVVPNPMLMDDHQAELGQHLAAAGILVCARPEGLLDALRDLDPRKLVPYSRGSAASIVQAIDRLVGCRSRC